MSKEMVDDFVEALRKLEADRDVEGLVEIHTEDCEVGNVSTSETFRGHEGLCEFWTEYRKSFHEMKSTFRNVFATEEGAALEWTTEGTSNGDTVSYDGVSILEIDGDKVRRFMAYFDTRDLTPPNRGLIVPS
jgi:SnoaL-like domain